MIIEHCEAEISAWEVNPNPNPNMKIGLNVHVYSHAVRDYNYVINTGLAFFRPLLLYSCIYINYLICNFNKIHLISQ